MYTLFSYRLVISPDDLCAVSCIGTRVHFTVFLHAVFYLLLGGIVIYCASPFAEMRKVMLYAAHSVFPVKIILALP